MNLKELLNISVDKNASDLHLVPNSKPTLRIDGDLVLIDSAPIFTATMTEKLIMGALDESQKKLLIENREFDFGIIDKDIGSFRVNAFYQVYGLAAVFRVISTEIPTLEKIQTPPVFKEILQATSGLVIVAGPTGCGKSTTLAAMIDFMNKDSNRHIITIEDPIEFVHSNNRSLINQRQVHRDTKSFSSALRAALREDPDVILVGEMRDLETVRLALTAAETGHLVMATLHTSSAPRAISRIVDVFPAGEKNIIKNMISESLNAVICQTLLHKKEGGQVAAFEIMLGVPAIRNLIREDKIAQMYSIMQTNADKGMCTMEGSVKKLVDNGVVERESTQIGAFQREYFEKL